MDRRWGSTHSKTHALYAISAGKGPRPGGGVLCIRRPVFYILEVCSKLEVGTDIRSWCTMVSNRVLCFYIHVATEAHLPISDVEVAATIVLATYTLCLYSLLVVRTYCIQHNTQL